MAVIQDLPTELIYRILELVEAYNRYDLLSTSLVCRDWTASSQTLLPRDLLCYTASDIHSVAKHLTCAKSARTEYLLLHLVDLPEAEDLKVARDLLAAAKSLRSLTLIDDAGRSFEAATLLSSAVMASLEALSVAMWLKGPLSLPSHIPLRTLQLDSSLLHPPANLDPILHSAADLQNLTLYVDDSAPLPQNLLDIAPRLTRLKLIEAGADSDSSCPSCFPLLAACTGLRTLELEYWRVDLVVETLQACRSELVVLATVGLKTDDSAVCPHRPLQDAFKFICLAKLRRWRLSWYYGLEHVGRDDWRRGCEERGIEFRGRERYFTDYCEAS